MKEHQTESLHTFIGLMRTTATLEKIVRQDVSKYDLNINEFSVLELLLHKGPQTIQTIKEKILIASSSTTYLVNQLNKKGFINKTTDETDRRITYVSLTPSGKELIDLHFPTHAKTIQSCFKELTTEELDTLQKLLLKINNKQ